MMPQNGLELLRPFSAIYFGAVGAPDIPDHITLWGLRLAICQGFDQYVNLRPTRILQGLSSPLRDCKPADLDWAIVRENTEGEYSGQGGRAHRGFPEEVATETSIFTRSGVTPSCDLPSSSRRIGRETAHRRHQIQRATPRHGSLG
jgi:tartrate dehydrogenase/decarboxylase/D-malate dehydrogenase